MLLSRYFGVTSTSLPRYYSIIAPMCPESFRGFANMNTADNRATNLYASLRLLHRKNSSCITTPDMLIDELYRFFSWIITDGNIVLLIKAPAICRPRSRVAFDSAIHIYNVHIWYPGGLIGDNCRLWQLYTVHTSCGSQPQTCLLGVPSPNGKSTRVLSSCWTP